MYSKLDSGERIEEENLNSQLNWKTIHSQQSWEKMEGHIFLPELSLKAKLRKEIYSKIFYQFHLYFLSNNLIFQY